VRPDVAMSSITSSNTSRFAVGRACTVTWMAAEGEGGGWKWRGGRGGGEVGQPPPPEKGTAAALESMRESKKQTVPERKPERKKGLRRVFQSRGRRVCLLCGVTASLKLRRPRRWSAPPLASATKR
jgi:hypothetical protein